MHKLRRKKKSLGKHKWGVIVRRRERGQSWGGYANETDWPKKGDWAELEMSLCSSVEFHPRHRTHLQQKQE